MLGSFPSPLVPATVDGDYRDGGRGSGAVGTAHPGSDNNSGLVSPSRVRSRDDMWLSSRTFYVLDAEVRHGDAVKRARRGRGGGGGVGGSFR